MLSALTLTGFVCNARFSCVTPQLALKATEVLQHVLPLWEAAQLAVQQREKCLAHALQKLTNGHTLFQPCV